MRYEDVVVIENAGEEYSITIPKRAKFYVFQPREGVNVRFSSVAGNAANETDPYLTMINGEAWSEARRLIYDEVWYFASDSAPTIVEVMYVD